jgi:D-alanyl-D-alanine carboxypeptidase
MISDASDLKVWAETVCTGKLLKPETQRARLRAPHLSGAPDFEGYGEGIWKIGEFCGHWGRQPGFVSAMWYLPERDATIVVNVNREDQCSPSAPSEALTGAIANILFPKYVPP